jgi:hypothetical protein
MYGNPNDKIKEDVRKTLMLNGGKESFQNENNHEIILR